MGKNKLYRFSVNEQLDNVIQKGKPLYAAVKGQWNSLYFKNSHPILLELGCGNGEYTVGFAQHYEDKNFIGIDIKGSRIYKGAIQSEALKLKNVAFLRTKIDYIDEFFETHEVSEIWITFPDPQPKDSQVKKRLTHPRFLEKYKRILKPGGIIHLKTDSKLLYDYTRDMVHTHNFTLIHDTSHLYTSDLQHIHLGIQTKYEKMFLAKGLPIFYLSFCM